MARAHDLIRHGTRYEDDGYAWAQEQAALLRAGRLDLLDRVNLAEEIESLGKSFAKELRSRYGTLLTHLLKWQFQPDRRSHSWAGTIRRERIATTKHLRDNLGLKPRRQELFADVWDEALQDAVVETNLPPSAFPAACPCTLAEAMDESYWPGAS